MNFKKDLYKTIELYNDLVNISSEESMLKEKSCNIFIAESTTEFNKIINMHIEKNRGYYKVNPFNNKEYTFNPLILDLDTIMDTLRLYEFDFSEKHEKDYYYQLIFLKNVIVFLLEGFPNKEFNLYDLYKFPSNINGCVTEMLKSIEISNNPILADISSFFYDFFYEENNDYANIVQLRYILKSLSDSTNSSNIKNYLDIASVSRGDKSLIINVDEREYGDEGFLLAKIIVEMCVKSRGKGQIAPTY
ncbi:hypothetical protein [Anaerosalibacter sp. Marseille-P3206]|uniref:hypothetical protein n=1 Tax=Anaerosalibacter sp. Marseille-P3206 TaxID=1871005 RepID=UPI0009847A97|nr:hypothetical protein [Anaerosalibacter sp. Marseille-P3206]